MVRYRYKKQKSNYISVPVTVGLDAGSPGGENTEAVCLQQRECRLVFALFAGEHTASACFDAGRIGEDRLTGELTVHYAYERGKIRVCGYDYAHQGYFEKRGYHTPPHMQLYRERETGESGADGGRERLFSVSGSGLTYDGGMETGNGCDRHENGTGDDAADGGYRNAVQETIDGKTDCAAKDAWLVRAAQAMQKQLRTVYQSIQKCLEGSGISLAVHIQDRLFKDPQTGSLKGCAIGVIPAWQGFFYNIEKSSKDPYPSGYESWLDYYDKQVIVELAKLQLSVCHDVEGHEYCASIGYGILCGKDRFVGGHILRGLLQNPGNPSDYVIHAEDDFYYCTQQAGWTEEIRLCLF